MRNLFYYIGLAIIGIVCATYTIYKKRDVYKVSTLLVFYFFTASLTWIGEFTVLGLFNSYAYKTGLFTDPWAQNLLGHLLINTTLYPSAAIIMVGYGLRYKWMIFVAVLFTLIEVLFVKMGIYEQHWWRYYMTIIAVIIFLVIFQKSFIKMNERRYGFTRATIYYFVAMLIIHIPAPVLLLLGKQYYQISFINNLVGNLYLASIIIIFFYHLIEAFILVLFTCVIKKECLKVIPIIISVLVQIICAKLNILVIKENWNLIYTLLIYEIFIVAYILIERFTLKPELYPIRK